MVTGAMVRHILLTLATLIAIHQAAAQPTLDPLLDPSVPPATLPVATPPLAPTPDAPTPPAATGACVFTPTWFPTKYEESASPEPLRLSSQVAAGWPGTGDPFRVGLSDAAVPKFYIGVNWFMLTQDTVPTACMANLTSVMCATANAVVTKEAGAGRRLLQTAVVTKAVQYSISWQLNTGPANVMPAFVPGQGRQVGLINLANMWTKASTPDGDYCLRATVSVPARSGTVTMGGKSYDVPCQKLSQVIKYCFVKVADKPTATVKWSSCNSNFTVSVTDIKPKPAYAWAPATSAGGQPAQLFSVIVQVWGNATKDDIDDTRTDDRPTFSTFDSAETIEIKDPTKDSATFSTATLLDGRYTLHVNLRLKSAYPQLNNLSGPTLSSDGVTTTYLGVPALNGEKGVRVTVFHEKSDVYGVTCPTDPVVKLPAPRTFQWSYSGEGVFNCFLDGKLIGKKNACEAPLQLTLNDRKNHTLMVVFTDKCEQQIAKKIVFGAWGCLLDRSKEPPSPPPPPPPAPEDVGAPGISLPAGFSGNVTAGSAASPAVLPALWSIVAAAWLALLLH